MTGSKKRSGLGRGLSSLLDDVKGVAEAATRPSAEAARTAPIDLVSPNPDQPRRLFKPAEMDDLANSIREKGVLQPLLVRPDPERPDAWRIVAGERRWRAAQAAGLHEVPVLPIDLSDDETLEVAIIENVQRADLNPMEEAEGYERLIRRFGRSQADLARSIGKSRPYVANALRLLALPEDVRNHLAEGRITAGHARALVTSADPSTLAQRIVRDGLSVRETERLAKTVGAARAPAPAPAIKDADTRALERDLSAVLGGLRVAIDHKRGGAGELRIGYKSLEDLDSLCRLLAR